jgi:localization factor PodJL
VFLFLLLLALLGGAGWWTYTNYLSAASGHPPQAPVSPATAGTVDDGGAKSAKSDATEQEDLPVRSAAPATPPVVTPDPPARKTSIQAETKAPEVAATVPTAARHEVSATRLPAAQPAADSGDSLFRQGERYLYGRGGTEDCANAQKYLKMASDKQNAKARSAMGTMYATGHCVSRDLPSAYRWFALALRADPNNTVVEQNLSSVWNQMTPPERQLATKSQ